MLETAHSPPSPPMNSPFFSCGEYTKSTSILINQHSSHTSPLVHYFTNTLVHLPASTQSTSTPVHYYTKQPLSEECTSREPLVYYSTSTLVHQYTSPLAHQLTSTLVQQYTNLQHSSPPVY